MSIKIKNANIVDPENFEGVADILIEKGKVVQIANNIKKKAKTEIEAKGLVLTPGLIDVHTHLREPGEEYKETIESGVNAAARGGFTTICAMPNTKLVNDNAQITKYIIDKANSYKKTTVLPIGAITFGLNGEKLTEFGYLKKAGAVAFSDDGKPVADIELMRRALEYSKAFNLFIISHSEELKLTNKGVMNEGALATEMGLPGIPNLAESIAIKRDVELAKLTNSKLHIAHISTKDSVEIIRDAKKKGVNVTAETAPHYFTLTEEAVKGYNTNAKMSPPLRNKKDRDAIIKGLQDGTIDIIATDHAPHSSLEKNIDFESAANGIIGLETSFPISYLLVEKNFLSFSTLIKKMSKNPAKLLGINNDIKPNAKANLTIFDLKKPYKIDKHSFLSKSQNTPFNNFNVTGKPVLTIVNGKIAYIDPSFSL